MRQLFGLGGGVQKFLLGSFFARFVEHAPGSVVLALNRCLVAKEKAHLRRFRRVAEEVG
jgi:hypothetical protein